MFTAHIVQHFLALAISSRLRFFSIGSRGSVMAIIKVPVVSMVMPPMLLVALVLPFSILCRFFLVA
jgi:hypothetical protein